MVSNIRIYILCHNLTIFDQARDIYRNYSWAHPVLMKYQDASFENAFWQQMLELYDEWKSFSMVGAMSYSLYKKLHLDAVSRILYDLGKTHFSYYHFLHKDRGIFFEGHPNLEAICVDVINHFGFTMPNENNCNYWVCKPALMREFIQWYMTQMKPYIFAHPLAFTDAKYHGGNMTAENLQNLTGAPYYPHIPFVLERLNKCFFDKALANGCTCGVKSECKLHNLLQDDRV